MDPITLTIQLVIFAISVAASIALAPKTPKPKPTQLSEGNVPLAEKGRPVMAVFGTCIVQAPNVVAYGDVGYKAVYTKSGK